MSEIFPWFPRRGPKGDKGERGERGVQGERGEEGKPSTRLPVKQARAVVYLFFFSVLVSLACLVGLVHYSLALSAEQRATSRQQALVAREQHELVTASRAADKKTCGTIVQITGIPAAAGTWAARFEAIERNRLRELGCKT